MDYPQSFSRAHNRNEPSRRPVQAFDPAFITIRPDETVVHRQRRNMVDDDIIYYMLVGTLSSVLKLAASMNNDYYCAESTWPHQLVSGEDLWFLRISHLASAFR